MARSCGIRIGPRRLELVVLDGSPRKHKIAAFAAKDYAAAGEEDPQAALVATLHEVLKTHNVPRENVGIAVDTGLAAFRTLTLPFKDRSKIEEVLKFEVEGKLPQWNIDDVIVDFFELGGAQDGNRLLITAVRKDDLRDKLDACVRAGFDPQEAELETSAMVNAAWTADVCHADDAQVLVHVGEHSTSLVIVDGGQVREMRAIHIGALSHEVPPADAEDPLTDNTAEEAEELEPPDPLEVQRRIDQAVKRIRREIGRSISGARTQHEIDSVYVCGLELPGLVGQPIQDVPVYALDVFEEDSGQPADGIGPLVVPYGVAVRQLGGGVLKPHLRRDELRYTGTFEKLELPLAVVCLLLLTFLGVKNIFLYKELEFVTGPQGLGNWLFNSNVFLLGDPKLNRSGNLEYPSERVKEYVAQLAPQQVDGREVLGDDPQRNRYEQLQWIRKMLTDEVRELEENLGGGTDELPEPQSALKALTKVLEVLKDGGDTVGRPSIHGVRAQYQLGRRDSPDSVRVTMDLTFFADTDVAATGHYEEFVRLLKEKLKAKVDPKPTEPLEDGKGISIRGLPITVNLLET